MMATPVVALDSRQNQLDSLLEQICRALQLTQGQYEDLKQKYEAVGTWLSAEGSTLRPFTPDIHSQGSVRLGTTNRPWRGEEYDLDIVCQLHGCGHAPPLSVYEAVFQRIVSNERYSAILERKKRCLRLNYFGNSHLDILPACPDPHRGGTCVKVPDCQLKDWSPSNPVGFAEWFFVKCKIIALMEFSELRKAVRPLPSPVPSEYKYPLQRIVQLMKRHRDSFFDGNRDDARSVVLTTLAAESYGGEQSLIQGLDAIVGAILRRVESYPGILPVLNPTNPYENFADSWTTEGYARFKAYIRNFRRHLDKLLRGEGLDMAKVALSDLFGGGVTAQALKAYGLTAQDLRERNQVRLAPRSSTLTTSVAGLAIPRNNFFGRG
jgi:hypothetical protein